MGKKTDGKKRCATCHCWFPSTKEYFNSNGTDGSLRGSCIGCRSSRRRGELVAPPEIEPLENIEKSDRYVVTYAQNATPVNQEFFDALKHYCKHNDAQLVVIAGSYKNPTSVWSSHMEHDNWWAPELKPYLLGGNHKINDNLTIYGKMSIQPTAKRPVNGLEGYAEGSSGVFGHPKVQHLMIATDKLSWPRSFTSTGAITVRNYTPTKIGMHGEIHHTFGATVIERAGKRFHIRQIDAEVDTGCFYELDKYYTPDGVEDYDGVDAIVFGDIHAEKPDKDVISATFTSKDSIVNILKPKICVYHDVHDHDTRNHHRIHNFHDRYARAHGDKNDLVERELERTVAFIDDITPKGSTPVIIQSNHDDAFDRWLNEAEIKQDPLNARLFYEMKFRILEHYDKHKEFVPAFEFWYNMRGKGRAEFIRRGQEFKIANIACGFHGDKGTNGARPSVLSYSKLGVKTITGHSHSPAIMDGAYVVGITGSLRQGYNEATPSSWFHTHCIIYPNSSRSLVSVVGNCWRR